MDDRPGARRRGGVGGRRARRSQTPNADASNRRRQRLQRVVRGLPVLEHDERAPGVRDIARGEAFVRRERVLRG